MKIVVHQCWIWHHFEHEYELFIFNNSCETIDVWWNISSFSNTLRQREMWGEIWKDKEKKTEKNAYKTGTYQWSTLHQCQGTHSQHYCLSHFQRSHLHTYLGSQPLYSQTYLNKSEGNGPMMSGNESKRDRERDGKIENKLQTTEGKTKTTSIGKSCKPLKATEGK